MVKLALFVKLEAKPGKEKDVESFLSRGLALVQQEPATIAECMIAFNGRGAQLEKRLIVDLYPCSIGCSIFKYLAVDHLEVSALIC